MAADRKARSIVFKTLEEVTLVEIKDAIERETKAESIVVLQELKPQEYLAEFKEKDDAEKIIEIGFDLASSHITCNPPKGYYTNVSLMGLRAYIEDEKVVEILGRYGEIKSPVLRLKYKTGHDLAGLENGNRLVKMVLNQPSIPYSLKIDSEWCRIIHSGQQPYCSTCSEFGHSRRQCEKTECHKCKKHGHIALDCKVKTDNNNTDEQTPNETSKTLTKKPEQSAQISAQDSRMEHETPIDDERQGTKRPHSSDTNDSDNPDGFTTVQNRRSKIPIKPNIETSTRKNSQKDKRPNGSKPPEKAIKT